MPESLPTQPSCADASDPNALSVADARRAIRAALTPFDGFETVPVRNAPGRALADDCVSPIDVPSHTNSAVDGYAVRGEDLPADGNRELRVIATALAGQTVDRACRPGECVRIMTGAPMPPGTDTALMQEHVVRLDDDRIRLDARHRRGQNIRLAGEDITAGTSVLHRGRVLTAADIGVLASLGFSELRVRRRPRVAFFSTGDELRSVGQPLGEGEIYDSNRYTLHALLAEANTDIVDLGVVRDDPVALKTAFGEAAATADVLITSGGVSVGDADYTKRILSELGEMSFWSLAMKPGRPLTFGRLGRALFFGLPGNPVAVMLTFHQFVRPALRMLVSGQWPVDLVVEARSRVRLKKRAGRFEYVRGILDYDAQGRPVVGPSGPQGWGVLTSMSRANCFILLDEACDGVDEGDVVRVQPFDTTI
jgi:molybdopterin molybdotransferase